ncbi:hypothetical protein L596_024791 [Steinernema carpocapsae]|uniref:cystathionine beta-synthase n=1 Tax=Steinernema carpocapsae TaxID=34508 RepID=A0A4U5M5S7_STECR|nr:hypothetical protein L596_024791 [Steinernema carpocapsae]
MGSCCSERVCWSEDGVSDQHGLHKFKAYPVNRDKILKNVLEAVGNTPLVKLHKIPQSYGIECNVYVKPEFFNAGGSVKDRIAVRMVEIAEQEGRLRPGMTIIEPTSGNTGIGLALVAAVKGYKCIIVMPAKMSKEKADTMKALGAQIVRTPDDAPYDSPESHIGVAFKMHKEIKDSIVLDQYINCGNPMAHYEGTGSEIVDALDGNVDMVVVGTGTGGTISGVSKKCKSVNPNCIVVGVDPVGSIISSPTGEKDHFEVEGIGYDFTPAVLDTSFIDEWVRVADKDTFLMARRLIKEEGLLSGGSSGANMWGAMQAAKKLKKGQNCVVVLPDSIRNYMTKFLTDEWMVQKKFMEKPIPNIHFKFDSLPANGFKTDPVAQPENEWQVGNPRKLLSLERPKVLETITDAIGWTPMVKLNRIPQAMGLECDIYVKCEYLNAGGSAKDRAALRMVDEAEASGALRSGMTIIEPSCGNAGICLAIISAIRGYKCIVVMPEKMSQEKEVTLHALGAQIVRTATDAKFDSAESYHGVALRLHHEIKDSIILDQYRNLCNPLAHYETTAEEILEAVDGSLDMLVTGVGTGGTISGISRKVKEVCGDCTIVGVDSVGSVLADPLAKNQSHELEGLGQQFVPAVLDKTLVDKWVQADDKVSFEMARKLIKDEGILCGGSSGANVWAACQAARGLPKGKKVVVVLPDSVRNYMSSFLDDGWMLKRGFAVPE